MKVTVGLLTWFLPQAVAQSARDVEGKFTSLLPTNSTPGSAEKTADWPVGQPEAAEIMLKSTVKLIIGDS